MPFTSEQFFGVLAAYNGSVWPAQAALLTLGFFLAYDALQGHRRSVRRVWLGLGILWAWMGLFFHYGFFRAISPVAIGWAILFLLQALLFFRQAAVTVSRVTPSAPGTLYGVLTILYATVGYPLLTAALGHQYPAVPTFGLPCPTVIATFGLLALVPVREPWWLAIIPTIWAIIGSTMVTFGLYQDLGLPLAALGYWILQLATRQSRFAQVFTT